MTKEQEIYKNMKETHHIRKSHGKWFITYPALYVAIKRSGYPEHDTIEKIISGMITKGYLHQLHDINGKEKGRAYGFIIDKWIN